MELYISNVSKRMLTIYSTIHNRQNEITAVYSKAVIVHVTPDSSNRYYAFKALLDRMGKINYYRERNFNSLTYILTNYYPNMTGNYY